MARGSVGVYADRLMRAVDLRIKVCGTSDVFFITAYSAAAGGVLLMASTEAPEAVESILRMALSEPDYPNTFVMCDKEWSLHRNVFPSTLTAATEVMASLIPFPKGGHFLEIGSGTGVISVMAALRGCLQVTAVDINPAAVANTTANAERHGVGAIVRALQSNLFESLSEDDQYDMIFWNVPWTYVDDPFPLWSPLHVAVFDPGYRGQAAYLEGASRYLSKTGRLLLGTADLGNHRVLESLAVKVDLQIALLKSVRRIEVHRVMEYQLLEFHRRSRLEFGVREGGTDVGSVRTTRS